MKLLILIAIFPLQLFASTPQFPNIESPHFKVEPAPKKLPPDGRPFPIRIFSTSPSGLPGRASRSDCSALAFEELSIYLEKNGASSELLQQRFTDCEKHLRRFSSPDFFKILRFAAVSYHLQKHNLIREVRLQIAGGPGRKALLGLKQGKRPLVVYQCGLFCDIYGLESKIMMMHLYDGMPFHVLLVGSVSGTEFVSENSTLSLGGFDEALQLMELFKILRDPQEPISKFVSSIHLVGSSLGSHSVLYSALYSSYMQDPPIKSATALCPVVDYKAAVAHLSEGKGYAGEMGSIAWGMLQENFSKSSDSAVRAMADWELNRMPEAVEEAGFRKFPLLGHLPAPLDTFQVRSKEDFWSLGRFSQFAHLIKIPTFAWAAEDDPIVLPEQNLKTLKPSEKIRILTSQTGSHCLWSSYYGWDLVTSLIKGHILAHANEFVQARSTRNLTLTKVPKLYDGETYFSYSWSAEKKNLKLKFKIWSPSRADEKRCATKDPYYAFEGCFRQAEVAFDYSKFVGADLFPPGNEAERGSMTRWANANLKLVGLRSRATHNTRSKPRSIQWQSYQ